MGIRGAQRGRSTGSVYLHVLGASLLVTIIGLAAVSAVRLQTRATQRASDYAEARAYAVSAVELGLLYVEQDPNWRTTWPNGAWVSDQPLGTGRFTLEGVDPQDGNLTNSMYEPLILTGTGMKGIARHKAQVVLVPVLDPLEALNTCLHVSGTVQVMGGHSLAVVGAPVSTNGLLDNDGLIDGDAEANSIADMKTISGTLTVPAPGKSMPEANVLSDYVSRATVIVYSGDVDKQVLTATSNPWGPADPNGLYFIDTGGSDIDIRNCRIHGTLIVRTGSSKRVLIDNAVFMQNYRFDCPVLIVDGNLEIENNSYDYMLSEASCVTNFNPVGAPYDGESDSDTADVYPNEIRGLIHVTGDLRLADSARIVGSVICEGSALMQGTNTIVHDPSLYSSPPKGYTHVGRMRISPGSWRQVVD